MEWRPGRGGVLPWRWCNRMVRGEEQMELRYRLHEQDRAVWSEMEQDRRTVACFIDAP
jgi:hypothetical protein